MQGSSYVWPFLVDWGHFEGGVVRIRRRRRKTGNTCVAGQYVQTKKVGLFSYGGASKSYHRISLLPNFASSEFLIYLHIRYKVYLFFFFRFIFSLCFFKHFVIFCYDLRWWLRNIEYIWNRKKEPTIDSSFPSFFTIPLKNFWLSFSCQKYSLETS